MKKKTIGFLLFLVCLFSLTGCTSYVKDKNKKIVKNEVTGQNLTKNILCKPTDKEILKLYNDNKVKIEKLPECDEMGIASKNYDVLWLTIFVQPHAWLIIQIGKLVKNYGLAIILATLLIRLAVYPFTKKSALQSENMKKAKQKLDKLEEKYKGKNDQESMMQKSQEMMVIYKEYGINPLSGCIFSLIQIPLFFAFLEALNRLPAIFEEKFIGFELGTSPMTALKSGHWYYLIFVVLVVVTTFFSFKLNQTASMSQEQEKQMKMMMNMSIVFIGIASISMSTGIELYWIVNSGFTIIQNLLVKRSKKNANII